MATRKVSSRKRQLTAIRIISGAVVLFAVVLIALELTNVTHFFHTSTPNPQPSGPTVAQKKQEAAAESQQKEQAITNPPTSTTPTPSSVNSTAVSLTAKQQGSTVTVLTDLGSIGDGTCTLTVTNMGVAKVYTAQVIYQPQYSICAGFSIPVSDVGAGTWSLNLSVTSNGGTATKDISFEAQA